MKWFCLILLAGSVLGQPVARYNLYDTTDVQGNVYARYLRVDADQTSFTLRAWDRSVRVHLPPEHRHQLYVREDGNFEWDITLGELPDTNVFTYQIDIDGLNFYYQSELTEYEIMRGCCRPDSVVGSYAVYHADKRGNIHHADGSISEYRAGKAFHIYRPKVFDSEMRWAWCDIRINSDLGTLTIIVPWDFLRSATYPVIIDPTFGTTGVGASNDSNGSNDVRHCMYTMGGTEGTADSVTIHVVEDNNLSDVGTAIYDDLSTDCNNLIDTAVAEIETTAYMDDWISFEMAIGVSLSASTDYWLTGGSDATCNFQYDDNDADTTQGHFNDAWPFADPCSGDWERNDYTFSIYCTYTEAGAAPETYRRRRLLTGGR